MSLIKSLKGRIKYIRIRQKYKKSLSILNGKSIRPDTKIIISENGRIKIGERLGSIDNLSLSAVGGTIDIGNDVSFNRNCIIVSRERIEIGNNSIFGPNVCIYDHDHEFSIKGISKDVFRTSPVIIEEGAWIGANVTILRGTHVGHDSIIGAGVVLKNDVPPNSLVVGDRKLNIIPIEKRDRVLSNGQECS